MRQRERWGGGGGGWMECVSLLVDTRVASAYQDLITLHDLTYRLFETNVW